MKLIFFLSFSLFFNPIFTQNFNTDSLQMNRVCESLIANNFPIQNNDSLKVIKGNFFSKDIKHAIVRYDLRHIIFLNVYNLSNKQAEIELTYEMSRMNFINDSIHDINGDSVNDLSIHWYPSSGCCLADIYDCFIYNELDNNFIKTKIINPIFNPKKKITNSMSYGHPGDTKIYTFKWSTLTTDTILTYSWKENNTFWKEKIYDTLQIKSRGNISYVNEIPIEIKEMYFFDWFAPWLRKED